MNDIKLYTLVSQINSLPSFPELARKILDMINNNDVYAKDLGDVILKDSDLTLKIINVANSAFYSPTNEIKNVTYAVQYIGLEAVKSIAYTNALQVLKSEDRNNLIVGKFQEKCIVSAFTSKILINKINIFRERSFNAEDFYVVALFHDVGETVSALFYPKDMQDIVDEVSRGVDILTAEKKLKHQRIGMMLMRKWNMPELYADVCAKHHNLDPNKIAPETLFIHDILMISDAIAYELGYNPTYNNNYDIEKSIFRVGLREEDIFTEDGVLGEAEANIESQLTFLT